MINKTKKAIYLFLILILCLSLIKADIVFADIQLDKDAFKRVDEMQSLDTEGVLIFTDYSLELRNRQIKVEEKGREEVLNKLFMDDDIFGSETTLQEDDKASELFSSPTKYISKERDENNIRSYIAWTLYLILSIFIVFGTVYLTKKARVKFKGLKNNHLKSSNY